MGLFSQENTLNSNLYSSPRLTRNLYNMRFQSPLFVLAALITYVAGESVSRSHVRNFNPEAQNLRREAGIQGSYSHVQKRNPVIPEGKPENRLHIWIRLNTEPLEMNVEGVSHEGFNQLIKDTGGRHVCLTSRTSF